MQCETVSKEEEKLEMVFGGDLENFTLAKYYAIHSNS